MIDLSFRFDLYKSEPKLSRRAKRSLRNALRSNVWTNDSVDLVKFMNSEYYGEIKIGSPAQTFNVMFDTTWADSWLPSSHCAWTEVVCRIHNRYDGSKSSSYIPNGRLINMSYISMEGMLSTDTFHLAHVKLDNQTFMEATRIPMMPFIQYKSDGIIGLAFESKAIFKDVTPFFYNLIKQEVIKENIFTFYMNRDATTTRAGKVIFGATDRKHMKPGTNTTLSVIEKSFWKIEIDSIAASKNKTTYPISGKCEAIFDSSSNVIEGPAENITAINYMMNAVYVPGINKYAVNCREYAKLPDIHFVLNGNDFSIQSKYYVQRLTVENIEACFSPFVPNADSRIKYWSLGGAFMMEFYTEFDLDREVVNVGQTVF
ncbi:hypothetical protein QAD02_009090 [Eretmocerus hayati]|uniref:Uncharacterized protein n=1 Tax=Eretmocerus hayati TaxID=131215 RepID=A0ACC2N8H7_9HYME|nr:hypothetical protein QAD02_009090 [Eretmocerus hayati]